MVLINLMTYIFSHFEVIDFVSYNQEEIRWEWRWKELLLLHFCLVALSLATSFNFLTSSAMAYTAPVPFTPIVPALSAFDSFKLINVFLQIAFEV